MPVVGRGADLAWFDYESRAMPRRLWLLSLALSSVSGLLYVLIPAVIVYQLSMHNVFIELSRFGMMTTPPDWLFWLADARPTAVLALAGAGAVLGLTFRSPYMVGTLSWILLFPGFLSLTGFIALQLGERLGLKLWRVIRYGRRSQEGRRDWTISFLLQLVALFLALYFTPVVQDIIAPFLGGDNFNAFWRFIQAYVLLVIWVSVEVILAMGIFHFYAQRDSA